MGLRNAQGLNHDLYIGTLVGGLRHPLFYMYINAESLTLCLYSWLSMDFAAIVNYYHLLSDLLAISSTNTHIYAIFIKYTLILRQAGPAWQPLVTAHVLLIWGLISYLF